MNANLPASDEAQNRENLQNTAIPEQRGLERPNAAGTVRYTLSTTGRRAVQLAAILVILLLSVATVSVLNVRSLADEIDGIVNRDLRLTLIVGDIETVQLQQSLKIEQAIHYSHLIPNDPTARLNLHEAKDKFTELSSVFRNLIFAAKGVISETLESAKTETDREKFKKFRAQLQIIDQQYELFREKSDRVFSSIGDGFSMQQRNQIADLEAKVADLNNALIDINNQIKSFTIGALQDARSHEIFVLTSIAVVGLVSVIVAVYVSFLIIRGIIYKESAEDVLRASEENLRAIVDNAADGIITIDERGCIESFNFAAERIFQYASREVIGRNVRLLMPEPMRGQHDSYLSNYLRTGEKKIIGIGREVVGLRKDGSEFPLDLAIGEAHMSAGRRFTGTLRDLTDRKILEERSQQARKLEALGRLAGGMAHDFNNLLQPIIAYTTVTREDLSGDEVSKESLSKVLEAAEMGKRLVAKIMTFGPTKAEERETIDFSATVSRSIELVRPTLSENTALRADLEPDVGNVLANKVQVHETIANLIANADDAIGRQPGSIEIIVKKRRIETDPNKLPRLVMGQEGDYALLVVKDTGCGMDSAVCEEIFEPFFTTKPTGSGTGLGLAVVQGVVTDHGGTIKVTSEVDIGTTFEICLPIVA